MILGREADARSRLSCRSCCCCAFLASALSRGVGVRVRLGGGVGVRDVPRNDDRLERASPPGVGVRGGDGVRDGVRAGDCLCFGSRRRRLHGSRSCSSCGCSCCRWRRCSSYRFARLVLTYTSGTTWRVGVPGVPPPPPPLALPPRLVLPRLPPPPPPPPAPHAGRLDEARLTTSMSGRCVTVAERSNKDCRVPRDRLREGGGGTVRLARDDDGGTSLLRVRMALGPRPVRDRGGGVSEYIGE